MGEYLEFADTLARRIDAFCAATGLRADGGALVSCGCHERHFVRAEALETHLVRSCMSRSHDLAGK